MGGGSVKQDKAAENQIAQSQVGVAQQQVGLSKELQDFGEKRAARSDQLQQPLIDYLNSIVSGDQSKVLTAAAPQIGNITQGYSAAKENVFNNVAPGAGRDAALAQLETQKASAIPTLLNSITTAAPQELANLSGAQLQAGLQGFGGATSGLSGASNSFSGAANTYGNVLQADEQGKASTLNFIGSLAGAAGTAAGGGVFGKLGK